MLPCEMRALLVLLWLSARAPTPEEQAALDDWAREHRVRLVAPTSETASAEYTPETVAELERLLEAAHHAVRALDPLAPARLEHLRSRLMQHPELPQAAWLEAERRRLAAELEARSVLAAPHEAQPASAPGGALDAPSPEPASALEGPSAPAFGDRSSAGLDTGPASPPVRLELSGARAADALYVDGARVDGVAAVAPGLHLVQVYRHGRLRQGAWLELRGEHHRITAPPIAPCSRADLTGASDLGARPHPGADAECPSWLAARAAPRGGVEIARCTPAGCDAWSPSSRPPLRVARPPALERPGLPGWTPWVLAGAGLALASGFVLWQTGALERERSREFSFTGPSAPPAASVSF